MTLVLHGVDGVLGAVGRHAGYSDWLVVDQQRVDEFAAATRDQAADPSRPGAVPENLVLSLSNYFLPQLVAVDGVAAGINYGAEEVRFPLRARVGQRLRAAAEVLAAVPIAGGVQTTIRITLEAEGDGVVCVVDSLSRFLE